jgi:hypothetical protein
MFLTRVFLSFIVVIGAISSSAFAEERSPDPTAPNLVGKPFPPLSLTDQHDHAVVLPGDAKVVVMANTKAVDEWANPVLAAFGPDKMDEYHVVYLSDIHRMPWMVSKMIALPRLRERTYSVALIREEIQPSVLPEPAKGCVDWIALKAGQVTKVTPVCSAADLSSNLGALDAGN